MNNLVWLTILVVVESLQLLAGIVYLNTFFPPMLSMQAQILPEKISYFSPEREMLLYRIFVMTAMILEAMAVWRFKSMLSDVQWGRRLRRFLAVEALVLALLCYVIFKVLVYHHPYMMHFFWPALLVLALAVKLFWPHVRRMETFLQGFVQDPSHAPALRMAVDIAVPLFIFLVIYLPNPEAVLAQMYMVEQFHHFNTLIMVPAFASSMGCVLNVDVNSQYGVGMPMLIGFLAKGMGGVTYAHVLSILVAACIVYYWMCYAFLRMWLKNALLAAIGIVVFIKWQMFDCGMTPNVFIVPNGLVVRFFWDIIFFMLVYRHIQKQESWPLAAAAILAGGAVVYVSDTGTYLMIAFYAYVLYLMAENHFLKKMTLGANAGALARFLIIPFFVLFGLYWLAVGSAIFQPVFWNNVKEFFQFFQDGYEAVPFYYALSQHRYLDNVVGLIIPLVYGLTFLCVGTLIFLKKIKREHAMVLVVCAYGMASYHYFLNRSTATSYYVQSLAFVFVLCYWLNCALGLVASQKAKRNILMVVLAFAVFALATTHAFLTFPGMLNFRRNPITDPLARPRPEIDKYYFNQLFTRIPEELKLPLNSLGQSDEGWKTEDDFKSDQELVDYYHKDFDFSKDADLIARLTPPGSPAAVMSSFDIKLLMQAERKPFFYCFPLLVERPMRMRNFPSTHLHTIARLERTLKQIEEKKPEYIFMEKIFMVNEVPQNFAVWSSDVIALINYVRAYYTPVSQGYYLVAMKRKGS